jgi:hypothetical protein
MLSGHRSRLFERGQISIYPRAKHLFTGLPAMLLAVAAGCGGESSPDSRMRITGTVLLPPHQVARRSQWFIVPAQALSADVVPAPGVPVQLISMDADDVGAGNLRNVALAETTTDDRGRFVFILPAEYAPESCSRLLVQVGFDRRDALTRAFAHDATTPIAISFRSEAVVRWVLSRTATGVPWCSYTAEDFAALAACAEASPGVAVGATAGELNNSGFEILQVGGWCRRACPAAIGGCGEPIPGAGRPGS